MNSLIDKPTVDQDTSQNAAFLSANRVYQHRPSSIRTASTSSVTSNGAVAAALRAGSRTPDGISIVEETSANMADTKPGLSLPPVQRAQTRSPSHTAALVAAARAGQTKAENATAIRSQMQSNKSQSKPIVSPKPRRLSDHQRSKNTGTINTPNDTSSIAPTTSLVSLFERKTSNTPEKKLKPIIITPVKSIGIQSPKPLRPDGISSVFQMEVGRVQGQEVDQDRDKKGVVLATQGQGHSGIGDSLRRSKDDQIRYNVASESAQLHEGDKSNEVRHTTEDRDFATGGHGDQSDPIGPPTQIASEVPAQTTSRQPTSKPSRQSLQSTTRAPTAPIDIRPPRRPLSAYDTSSPHSTQSVSAAYRQLYPKRTTPLTTDDELANAIVASSLASSRLGSPRDLEPPPVPLSRRHSRHIFHSRTPSPVKPGLRQTLRKQESSDSEDDNDSHPYGKHQKKRLIRKHPNKHHEGDRKRWRDAVTQGERKRYEGVWAANKGLCITPTTQDADALNDQVSNVMVKEIWSRSRLPEFELEAVWDLVDNDEVGRLSREEFVVGMWLIDQRLKGRKLPVKVQPTVWTSVRGLQGIKIRKQR